MNAEDKLQNIKAVQQMLRGEHKTQTRKSFGYSSNTVQERREVGDTWEETDTKSGTVYTVTQHDGFRSKEPKNSVTKQIREILRVPDNCPECNTKMRNEERKLNYKFWFSRKKCFSCVLKEETAIRNQGLDAWQKYQNDIMIQNAESWFADTDKEVEILKTQMKETLWQNAQGETGDFDLTDFVQKVDRDYQKLKESIRQQFEESNDKIGN